MGNRKKSKQEKRDRFLAKIKGDVVTVLGPEETLKRIDGHTITLPESSKVVAKTVPATIHWEEFPASGKTGTEVIGETVIYEDGTFDMIINSDISDEAKAIANFIHSKDPVSVSLKED